MSIKKIFLPIFLISGTITAFIVSIIKPTTNPPTINSSNSNSSNQKKVDKTSSNPLNLQKLAILPQKCIGCGKCARIDSSHFEMNGNVAIVISSTNLNSQKLAIAINNCPTQAITLK